MAHFTFNVVLTPWTALLGFCVAALYWLIASMIVDSVRRNAEDRGYEAGYASGQADLVADSIDEIEEFANEASGFD